MVAIRLVVPVAAIAAGCLLSAAAASPPAESPTSPAAPPVEVAASIVAALPAGEREVVEEVLARNPELARALAAAEAAEQRAPQARSLPDPMATLTAYALPPETRVGPQRLSAGFSQRFPWMGKRSLREREALERAAAMRADAESRRLALVTETRRTLYELAFLREQERVLREDRATLSHYEEVARARYASGVGLQQAPVKLQAEITKDDNRLLDLANRRVALAAALNALRDREPGTAAPEVALPGTPVALPLDLAALRARASQRRPELARARALIAAAATGHELAGDERRPDLTVGVGYTMVGKRADAAGRRMPPEGNGDDVLGFTFGVNVPLWRARLDAAIEESAASERAGEEELRRVAAGIDQTLAELCERLPLLARQHELYATLLSPQAEESLRSVEVAYGAGAAGALDLVDAERVLLDVRVGAARALADYWIAVARLEGALADRIVDSQTGDAR